MEILRSVTQTVLGSAQPEQPQSGAELVDQVVERVVTSALLEDRRGGCRLLKGLAKKYRLHVGAHAMDALLQALDRDRTDLELVNCALETLIIITSPEPFNEEIEETDDEEACRGLGPQFTEILTKKPDNMGLFLQLLDEFDFKVRYPTVKLLTNLLENRPREVQECVLLVPSGVTVLMDLLADVREVIRNQLLLLLTHLTRGNPTLQKIVVYEQLFVTVFNIIKDEGYSSGGVVVEDCLELLLTLLKSNAANQTLLREDGHFTKINPFMQDLFGSEAISDWPQQKQVNVQKMLQLVAALVQPLSTQYEVSANQDSVRSCGILPSLCELLLAPGVPPDILTATITTIADVIRANPTNQSFFHSVMAPSVPPRMAVVVLIMTLMSERQTVAIRSAVLYCLQCFLVNNMTMQANLVATLLPQTEQAEQMTSGQLLCGGLFSGEPLSTWLCSVALGHAFLDNAEQKLQLLRVQLATSSGSTCVSLLQQCCYTLLAVSEQDQPKHFLTKVGFLQFLALWMLQCPRAVTALLEVDEMMPYLTAQISSIEVEEQNSLVIQGLCAFLVGACALYNEHTNDATSRPQVMNRAQIAALVTDRIGGHVFRNKLSGLSRTEHFATAARSHRLLANKKEELCFQHSFVQAYKSLEGSLLRACNIGEGVAAELLQEKLTAMKAELDEARNTIEEIKSEKKQLNESLEQQHQQIQLQIQQQHQLQQQLQQQQQQYQSLLSSQTSAGGDGVLSAAVQRQVADLTYARDYYYYQMLERDKIIQQQREEQSTTTQNGEESKNKSCVQNGFDDHSISVATDGLSKEQLINTSSTDPELDTLRCQLQDLQLVLQRKDETIYQLQLQHNDVNSGDDVIKQVKDLQSQLQASESHRSHLQQQLSDAKRMLSECHAKLQQSEERLQEATQRLTEYRPLSTSVASNDDVPGEENALEETKKRKLIEEELDALQSEQEDLLLLLAEQDGRLQRYRSHLIVRGVSPPPGEEDQPDSVDEDEEQKESLQ